MPCERIDEKRVGAVSSARQMRRPLSGGAMDLTRQFRRITVITVVLFAAAPPPLSQPGLKQAERKKNSRRTDMTAFDNRASLTAPACSVREVPRLSGVPRRAGRLPHQRSNSS